MLNNDILRRVRYAFDINDDDMINTFAAADREVNRAQISDWLKKEDDSAFVACPDIILAVFLNGFINTQRGKKDGVQPAPEKRLTNNLIFRKLRIALNLQDDDIIQMLATVDCAISKHELSAFFRKPDHRQYRDCKDQVLRNFLHGMQLKYRPDAEGAAKPAIVKPASKATTKPAPKAASIPSPKPASKKETQTSTSKPAFSWDKYK
ncbi:MAG: hypothetical protein AUK35_10750 [Zetaproteobacteria bacterium CG2_30_46_52]|nr:MAG: hypothetical protein AUK35_10750 [Zetaproteobacteria bacterium CG2_30_46_52]